MTTATHKPTTLRLPLALAGAFAALAMNTMSFAAPHEDSVRSVQVRYGDLNLATAGGAETLYRRISSAARQVCPDVHSRNLAIVLMANRCQETAIANAVQALNNPQLALVRASHLSRVSHG